MSLVRQNTRHSIASLPSTPSPKKPPSVMESALEDSVETMKDRLPQTEICAKATLVKLVQCNWLCTDAS